MGDVRRSMYVGDVTGVKVVKKSENFPGGGEGCRRGGRT
jgi:hypothetical protein